jgi:hypothetical protein
MDDEQMLQLENVRYDGLPPANAGIGERWGSIVSGLLMFLYGATQKSLKGSAIALTGAYLLFRGVTGYCFIYNLLNINRSRYGARMLPAEAPPPPSVEESDEVVESSWESFPTSDPPSWTMGKRGRA